MPRFYFDLHTSEGVRLDVTGAEVVDCETALTIAAETAEEMLDDGEFRGAELGETLLSVRDEQGRLIGAIKAERLIGAGFLFRAVRYDEPRSEAILFRREHGGENEDSEPH